MLIDHVVKLFVFFYLFSIFSLFNRNFFFSKNFWSFFFFKVSIFLKIERWKLRSKLDENAAQTDRSIECKGIRFGGKSLFPMMIDVFRIGVGMLFLNGKYECKRKEKQKWFQKQKQQRSYMRMCGILRDARILFWGGKTRRRRMKVKIRWLSNVC